MIPFIDLKAQYARIAEPVEQAVLAVMRSGGYILGPVVEQLEARLAEFAGSRHCVSCASGTDALVMALMAKGVGPGDAVFTVPFTFMASAEAIATVGATPVFVDIEPGSFNIDPALLEAAIAAHDNAALTLKGIIAVDLFGLPADYAAINRIAANHGLFVIEDAAQSFGASAENRRAGSLADRLHLVFPGQALGLLWRWRSDFLRRCRTGHTAPLDPGPRSGQRQV
jgi:UDP-2-acetamido-2-deoxy-ribo-hexuluronate aminotransferase